MRRRHFAPFGVLVVLSVFGAVLIAPASIPIARAAVIDTSHAYLLPPDQMADSLTFAQQQPSYAGAYFDVTRQSEPVFLFSNDADAYRGDLAERLPAGAIFDVATTPLSFAQLTDLRDRIFAARADLAALGIELTGVALHQTTNRVQVGIKDLTPGETATLIQMFGSAIEPNEEDVAVSDACNSMKDCWPMKSGLEIAAGNQSAFCTSGYLATLTHASGSPVVAVTAGHCIYQSDALNWYEGLDSGGNNENKIGNEGDETFKSTDGASIYADVGFIHYQNWGSYSPYNKIVYNNSPYIGNVVGTVAEVDQMEGTPVCRMGYGSGYLRSGYTAKTCKDPGDTQDGTIINTNATKNSCADKPGTSTEICNWVQNETVVNFDSTGGDSGGPYYDNPDGQYFNPNYMFLYGIHTHSVADDTCNADRSTCKGWLSPVDAARAALIVQFGTADQIDICINADCTLP